MSEVTLHHQIDHVMSNGEVVKIVVTGGDTELIKSHGFGASMTIVNEVFICHNPVSSWYQTTMNGKRYS